MRYAVVIEKGESNFSAYAPDLPGCVAAAESLEQTLTLMREAIEFHIEGLLRDGDPIPPPLSLCDYVEVDAKLS
jgi:predicted RNase H-like HicB family nuclease